jgi:hypothetical protein
MHSTPSEGQRRSLVRHSHVTDQGATSGGDRTWIFFTLDDPV